MEYSGIRNFLSEDSILLHLSYLKQLRASLSLMKKYYPELEGKTAFDLASGSHRLRVPGEIASVAVNCLLHDAYFSSFTDTPRPSRPIKKYYSSENAFCYEILSRAERAECGFVYALRDKRGEVRIISDEFCKIPLTSETVLAIDISEHAYFSDYGFRREEYLRRALSYLNLAKLFPEDGKTS